MTKKKPKERYTDLLIRLVRHEVRVDAAVSYKFHESGYIDADAPAYKHSTSLELVGECIEPPERAGYTYYITIYGVDSGSEPINHTIKDYRAIGKDGSPATKKTRNGYVPIYNPPPGIGLITKVRGEPEFGAFAHIAEHTVSSMLILLGENRPLYVTINELMTNRVRWVRRISVHTEKADEF